MKQLSLITGILCPAWPAGTPVTIVAHNASSDLYDVRFPNGKIEICSKAWLQAVTDINGGAIELTVEGREVAVERDAPLTRIEDFAELTFAGITPTDMSLTKEQQEQMLEAAQPLIRWMNENCHPHCTAHVNQSSVELVEGIATARVKVEE